MQYSSHVYTDAAAFAYSLDTQLRLEKPLSSQEAWLTNELVCLSSPMINDVRVPPMSL